MIRVSVVLLAALLLLTGCGPNAPEPEKNKMKRPSMVYKPDRSKLQLKYPLTVGVVQLNDKRPMPFYMEEGFFQEDDMEGLTLNTYLELKNSGLFQRVILINQSAPFDITDEYLQKMMNEKGLDAIFVGNVNSFNLRRVGENTDTTLATNSQIFTMKVSAGLIGQLIYCNGGHIIWSGEVKRDKRVMSNEDGSLSANELSVVTKGVLKKMFSDLKLHINKTGKRMRIQ